MTNQNSDSLIGLSASLLAEVSLNTSSSTIGYGSFRDFVESFLNNSHQPLYPFPNAKYRKNTTTSITHTVSNALWKAYYEIIRYNLFLGCEFMIST